MCWQQTTFPWNWPINLQNTQWDTGNLHWLSLTWYINTVKRLFIFDMLKMKQISIFNVPQNENISFHISTMTLLSFVIHQLIVTAKQTLKCLLPWTPTWSKVTFIFHYNWDTTYHDFSQHLTIWVIRCHTKWLTTISMGRWGLDWLTSNLLQSVL